MSNASDFENIDDFIKLASQTTIFKGLPPSTEHFDDERFQQKKKPYRKPLHPDALELEVRRSMREVPGITKSGFSNEAIEMKLGYRDPINSKLNVSQTYEEYLEELKKKKDSNRSNHTLSESASSSAEFRFKDKDFPGL